MKNMEETTKHSECANVTAEMNENGWEKVNDTTYQHKTQELCITLSRKHNEIELTFQWASEDYANWPDAAGLYFWRKVPVRVIKDLCP
jgi:hypothetical protein